MINLLKINKIEFKKYAFIGAVILGIILIFTIIGYIINQKKAKEESILTTENLQENIPSYPLPLEKNRNDYQQKQTTEIPSTDQKQISQLKYKPLFNKSLMYLEADYPIIYVYDPEEKVIKYIDIESETYRELVKVEDFKKAVISPDKQKIIIETDEDLYLLNIKNDTLISLPVFTKKYVFTFNKLVIYSTDGKKFSYLAYLEDNGNTSDIRDIGILNPELVFLPPNYLLIYNDSVESPVFLLNLNNFSDFTLFLDEEDIYSILPNKKGDLLFISSSKESKIIDLKKNILMTFPWSTTKEKCSFKEVLICGVSENFNYLGWHLYDLNFDDKIVIYYPDKNTSKEIKLESKFDIINPQLTSEGIIFGNRLDGKIYLLKID
jgi:hypothetical protein